MHFPAAPLTLYEPRKW